jgi:hypothetical protein
MRKLWIVIILAFIISCSDEELSYTPTVESLYSNQFKVWSKTDIIIDPGTGNVISRNESRDLNLQYILTPEAIHVSNDGGNSFNTFPDSYVGLDSIAFEDANSGARVSYFVLDVFRMKNGDPRAKNISNPRDDVFPELKGFYLFLQLENKNKPDAEGGKLTEILLMYSEGFAEGF